MNPSLSPAPADRAAAAAAAADASDEVALSESLLRYARVLRRRMWVILALIAIGVTAAVLYTMRQTKIYAATATVVVNPTAPRVFGSDVEEVIELGAGSYWASQEYYNTQIDILTGFPLAKDTVVKTRPGTEVAFWELLAPAEQYPGMSDDDRIDAAAEQLAWITTAAQSRESRIVGVTVSHQDPQLAKDLANEHVRSYILHILGKRTSGADKSSKFLSIELDAAAKKLRDAERKLFEFKSKNDIISVSLEDKQNIISNEIQRYSSALGDARVKRIELGALRKRAQGLKGDDVLESPVFALASNPEAVEAIKTQYVAEKQKFIEVQEEFLPKSEVYRKQEKKVADLYAVIEAEQRRALRELEERYQAAVAAESAFVAELDRLKKEALDLAEFEPAYNELAREAKSDAENYNLLLGRLRTSDQESRNEQINVEEHEYARGAYLVRPRMKVAVAIAFALSLVLGVGLAFLLDYLDRTIKSAEDVEKTVGAPLLGVIPVVAEVAHGDDPKSQRDRDLYVFQNPTSRAAECCRAIRTNILFSAADRPMRTITVSSPRPREGKTTTTIYMGTIMAQSGQKTLLVDTDLRRPRLHKSLGLSKNRGLTNLLLGDATIDDVVKSTDIPNLYVLPSGPMPPNPAELLLTDRFKQILAELEERFERVLLDSPPVLAVTDAVVLSRRSNGVIIIAQAGQTETGDLAMAARQFKDAGAPILGVIMNDMDITDKRYGGYYYYAYGNYGETAKSEG